MNRKLLAASLAVAFMAAAAVPADAVDFSRYVSIGDSLTAGYMSGGVVVTVQVRDYPALIAAAGGATGTAFQQPTISEPGIPPLLYLKSLSPLVIERKPGMGVPTNLSLPRPYNNLGIPGAISLDILQTITDPDNGFFDLVLRGQGTVVQQTAALNPTFVSCWIGNNDILGAAISGRAIDGVTMTPTSTFAAIMTQVFQFLGSYQGRVIVANIPDVTSIAYTNAISIYVENPSTGLPVLVNGQPVPLIGPFGPLHEGEYVLLSAAPYMQQGYGIPTALGGNGQPLPDETVLNSAEVAAIVAHVNSFNQTIATLAQQKDIPVMDFNALLKTVAAGDYTVGGIPLTIDFVTGGLFSLDGVHPNELGYAIIANEFILKINEKYDSSLPLVNLNNYLKAAPARQMGGWDQWQIPADMLENLKQTFLTKEAREYLDRTK